MKKIIMTGGGTAGHVTPNIALLSSLRKEGFSVYYVGTKDGIERQLIEKENIPYYTIKAGKLRRYLDVKNITDIAKISQGFMQSLAILNKLKPDILFSKGGFVSSPLVWAAWSKRIPVVLHESDITPGLANKIALPFAKNICYSFPETIKFLPKDKSKLTGIPVRETLFTGNEVFGRKLCSFHDKKPIIVIIGGSLGSQILNKTIRQSLDTLLENHHICHICGQGNIEKNLNNIPGYKQFEYISDELPHIFAMANIVVSRAGATTLNEILALKKPNILIPLSRQASRGDQILNAESYKKQGFSYVVEEETLNEETLINAINHVSSKEKEYIAKMEASAMTNAIEKVMEVICHNVKDTAK
ncbi:undecaprenyldiphospho-muramoylpentapeptide beta-N-acetylglucosaminyltransferase [Irregularibacter muris]